MPFTILKPLHSNKNLNYYNFSNQIGIATKTSIFKLVWDYKKVDSTNIRKALDSVNWERLFDQKDINTQVMTLNETILNVFRNYVPNKYITIDDKDPVWMNETIRSKIKTKNKLYKQYIDNGRFESDFVFTETLITEINDLITSTKNLYYKNLAKKLNNPLLQAKTYWSILKTFYNDKKNSYNSPLLIDDKFVTDIQTKANIFNKFFADQCTPLKTTVYFQQAKCF